MYLIKEMAVKVAKMMKSIKAYQSMFTIGK